MLNLLAADPAFMTNAIKPLLMVACFGAWAWFCSTRIDKWLEYYYLPRSAVNGALLGSAFLAMVLWIVIPIFWAGFFLAILILAGSIGGYIYYHNQKVPAAGKIDFNKMMGGIQEKQREKAKQRFAAESRIRMLEKNGSPKPVPDLETADASAHQRLAQYLEYAIRRKAEKLDLIVSSERAGVVVEVDGVKFLLPRIDAREGLQLLNYLKKHAGLDIDDLRRKQVGDAYAEVFDEQHQLAITTSGSTQDVRLSAVINPEAALSRRVRELGMPQPQIELVKKLFTRQNGIVLVSSPPDQGQTTTLYSLLQEHDPYMQTIETLEDEVAMDLEGITHRTFEVNDTDESVKKRLVNLSRQGLNVYMISRLPGPESAKTLVEMAEETRIYIGVRAEDTKSALKAWIRTIGSTKTAASSLAGIVSQRLIRSLCNNCKAGYTPDKALLGKLNLAANQVGKFYKASGKIKTEKDEELVCPECMGIGYRGRTGIFEVMPIDKQAAELIATGQLDQLRAHLRKSGMLMLQEAGIFKVVEGITSISEVQRVLSQEKDKPIRVTEEQMQAVIES